MSRPRAPLRLQTRLLAGTLAVIFFSASAGPAWAHPREGAGAEPIKIAIDYSRGGMYLHEERRYSIERKGGAFRTGAGRGMEEGAVMGLAKSLTGLERSGGLKGCKSHTDDYPQFRVGLSYADGGEIVLYSDSNCPKLVPWNVAMGGKLYVQYTGEIPDALFGLLNAMEPEFWKQPGRAGDDHGPASIPILSDKLPEEAKAARFSERAAYTWSLYKSVKFMPYALTKRVSGLQLLCQWSEKNRDCSEIEGVVTLKPFIGAGAESIPVKFRKGRLVEVAVSPGDRKRAARFLRSHALTKAVKRAGRGASLVMDHAGMTPSATCAEVFANLGTPAPAGCSPHAFRFENWPVYHEFVFLPGPDRIWVSQLHYRPENFERDKRVLGMSGLVRIFAPEGYERFVDENLADFEIQACHRMMAYFKEGALEANPGYIGKLKAAQPDLGHYGDRIDIYGYCEFVNDRGQLEAYRGPARGK